MDASRSRLPGRNLLVDLAARDDLRLPKLPGLLQVHPELWRRPEIPRKPQRGIRAHASLAVQDHRHPVHRYAQRLRKRVGRQSRARRVRRAGLRPDAPPSCRSSRSCQVPSVIIDDLHIVWSVVRPTEADAPLRVAPNAVLTGVVAPKCFQPIARQRGKVAERFRAVQQDQTARRLSGEALKRRDALTSEESSRLTVSEASYHARRV